MRAAGISRLWAAAILTVILGLTFVSPTAAEVSLPTGEKLDQVDFERHIMGLFGRMGCNSGSCHGSFQGKGGFQLSLFGYDPEMDYKNLTRDMFGRRVNVTDPDSSLLLLKATGIANHGGGRRISPDSWQYQVLREWIAGGAAWKKGSGEVQSVRIDPPEYPFKKAGEAGQLKVKARYKDGSEEDITAFSDYRINDDAVAEIGNLGQVKGLRAGDTAVVVTYRGTVVPVRVLVPVDAAPGFRYPDLPTVNYLDREVFAKLRRLNIVPSELSGDAEFLRRVYIDTIGTLPTADEVRAFLADPSPTKRSKKIDELLAHPMHAALWATKFSDITGNNTDALENPVRLKAKRSQMWHDWLRKRLAANVPYDELVKNILCATSRDALPPQEWLAKVNAVDDAMEKGFDSPYADKDTLDLFWRRQQNVTIDQWGEKAAAAFLGVRLECAQCHKHPFDRWTQAEYRAFANVFSKVSFGNQNGQGNGPETQKLIADENQKRRDTSNGRNMNQIALVREMFVAPNSRQRLTHPVTNQPLPPQALGGPQIEDKAGEDPRLALFEWMRGPDNPFFARSFVNRVWGHYLGVGIVEPVDDFSLANPPSNDVLLNALAKDFIEHKFDIRHIERTILNSRVYQLSSSANDTNRLDTRNYSHGLVRPMLAEVVVDVLNAGLGVAEDFGPEAPPNCRAIEIGTTRLNLNNNNNNTMAYVFRIFGRPPRTTACDCERALDPALPQKLFLMSDASLVTKLTRCRVQDLLKAKTSDAEVLEEMFLATLSRFPTEDEKKHFADYRVLQPDRQKAFVDTMWALINTREFILNH